MTTIMNLDLLVSSCVMAVHESPKTESRNDYMKTQRGLVFDACGPGQVRPVVTVTFRHFGQSLVLSGWTSRYKLVMRQGFETQNRVEN